MSDKPKPQSYKPVLEAQEVIDVFSRLTLHQQAALMRLISRNLEVKVNGESYMGYELDYEVVGAIIQASESSD
jgi:CRISPR/Cas system-associated endonuclease Cas3-HD